MALPSADVALLTDSRYEQLDAPQPRYLQNIVDEDALLIAALGKRGLTCARVDWARDDVDWRQFGCAVFRTTWDYFDRIDEFRAWLPVVAEQTRLFNPLDQVQWNIDKHYLIDLAAADVEIVPTQIIERGEMLDLAGRLRAAGWDEAVVKPAVSGAARHTYRLNRGNAAEFEARIGPVAQAQALLLQPFVTSVQGRGEVTLMMIDGEFTHAVRKVAAPGDFRVQDDHGGSVFPHEATEAERDLAERAISCCAHRPLYGRVDMLNDDDGVPQVMELELIEPELWLRLHHPAADKLGAALASVL